MDIIDKTILHKNLDNVDKIMKNRGYDYRVWLEDEKILWCVFHGAGIAIKECNIHFSEKNRAIRMEAIKA